ncbi:hypothetical protein [Aquimarina sediminis]|uniref:hypothetical protein n=1 Tax=Aquimarina sediminis TaxID=2070536 RepID=UPI000CA0244C|nr:hypothetical protein [Aquimarina sediminis]
MYILDPLYYNSTGAAYTLKNSKLENDPKQKIQIHIGDVAILMDIKEIESFLTVIRSAQKGCQCKDCSNQGGYKTIKCNTPQVEINFKLTPEILDGLEELVMGILFHEEYNNILENNHIN